jgi:hypothetical protein
VNFACCLTCPYTAGIINQPPNEAVFKKAVILATSNGTQGHAVKTKEKNYAGMITLQAWIKETETLLSDSEVLTLPGRFEPATPKSLA